MGELRKSNTSSRYLYRRSVLSGEGSQVVAKRVEVSVGTNDPTEAEARARCIDAFLVKARLMAPNSRNVREEF